MEIHDVSRVGTSIRVQLTHGIAQEGVWILDFAYLTVLFGKSRETDLTGTGTIVIVNNGNVSLLVLDHIGIDLDSWGNNVARPTGRRYGDM